LDLSKELTALVWLAGPLSGLLVQPVKWNTIVNLNNQMRRRWRY
jgi:hypothetical protein